MKLQALNLIFLVAFLLSAAVQYNDPDAFIWIVLYLAAAFMCIAQLRNQPVRWLPPVLLGISLVWTGVLLPNIVGQVSMAEIAESVSMKTQAVEEAREIGGLLIVTLWSAVLVVSGAHGAR